MNACRWLPLPLADYMRRVMLPLTPAKRRVVIYDQLNPAYAKYYTAGEAEALMTRRRVHRHPAAPSPRQQLDGHRPQARLMTPLVSDRRARLQRGGDARRVRRPPRRARRRSSSRVIVFEFVLVDDGSTDGSLTLAQIPHRNPSRGCASSSSGAISARRRRCRPASPPHAATSSSRWTPTCSTSRRTCRCSSIRSRKATISCAAGATIGRKASCGAGRRAPRTG